MVWHLLDVRMVAPRSTARSTGRGSTDLTKIAACDYFSTNTVNLSIRREFNIALLTYFAIGKHMTQWPFQWGISYCSIHIVFKFKGHVFLNKKKRTIIKILVTQTSIHELYRYTIYSYQMFMRATVSLSAPREELLQEGVGPRATVLVAGITNLPLPKLHIW